MAWCAQRGIVFDAHKSLAPFTHVFTHFKLHISPLVIVVARKPQQVQQAGSMWMDVEDAMGAAIPTPVRMMLAKVA